MYIIILISQFTIRVLCSFQSFQKSNSHNITGLPLLAGRSAQGLKPRWFQTPAAVLRDQGGLSVQEHDRSE